MSAIMRRCVMYEKRSCLRNDRVPGDLQWIQYNVVGIVELILL